MNISLDKNRSSRRTSKLLMVMAACTLLTQFASAATFPTGFTNIGSIVNTRHNMSVGSMVMNIARNDYEEVCVYCHTPHASNTNIVAPLWNRTVKTTSYNLYSSNTLTQTVAQPGGSSLACLSCHDGQTAIDSIINMPKMGNYLASQATTQNTAFLDSWNNNSEYGVDTTQHRGINSTNNVLGNGTGSDNMGCLTCHSPVGFATAFYVQGNDMRLINIGTDLRNDHPVGVTFPTTNGAGTDFNTPTGIAGTARFFDTNVNGKMDTDELRMYGPGAGGAPTAASATVECASCHDPHGVPSAGVGSVFNPIFLRMSNSGSAVCLTCHLK